MRLLLSLTLACACFSAQEKKTDPPVKTVTLLDKHIRFVTSSVEGGTWTSVASRVAVRVSDGTPPSFQLAAPENLTVVVKPVGAVSDGIQFVDLTIAGSASLPMAAYLIAPSLSELVEIPAPALAPWTSPIKESQKLLWASLILAAVATALGTFWAIGRKWNDLLDDMGTQGWDFARSWATNIAMVGGVLTAVTTLLPGSDSSYLLLSGLLAFLGVVAPIFYNLTTRVVAGIAKGKVLFFAFSALLSGTSALGQVFIASNLLQALGGVKLPLESVFILQCCVAAVWLALLYHIVTSVKDTISAQKTANSSFSAI